jgi:hypothetical protein
VHLLPDYNDLNGTIPTEIGLLTILTELDLGKLQEKFEIKPTIAYIDTAHLDTATFAFCFLGTNLLSGTVPTDLNTLSNLQILQFQNTDLTGDLDPVFCAFSFEYFDSDCGGSDPGITCACCTHCCTEGYCDANIPSEMPSTSPSTLPSISRFGFLHDLLAPTSTMEDQIQSQAVDWLANMDPAMLPLNTSPEVFRNRYALVVLYFSTNGGGWAYNDNWLSNSSVCQWYGVIYCTGEGYNDIVARLDLCKLLEQNTMLVAL